MNVNGQSCVSCEQGKFSNVTMPPFPKSCELCDPGKVATNQGSFRCQLCDIGKFSSPDRRSCRACSAGEFVNTTAFSCIKCPLGRFAPTALDDACLYCGQGFSTAGESLGARSCVDCSPGKYSAGGIASCFKCLAGQFAGTRAQACAPCPSGTFTATNQSSSCTNCAAGKFSVGNAETCLDCVIGKYSGARSTSCNNCTPGAVAATEGTVTCAACSAGTKAPVAGLSACLKCDTGRAQSEAGQIECRACVPGKYAPKTGAATCADCGVGTVTKLTGASACGNCPPGTFQPSAGLTECIECEAGRYQDVEAEAYCKNCASTYWSAVGSPLCTHCDVGYWYQGYYRRDDPVDPKDQFPPICSPCPEGGKCFGGLCVPIPKDGYWSDRSTEDPDDNFFMYRCPTAACVSGKSTDFMPYECDESWLITRYAPYFENEDAAGQVRRLAGGGNGTNATANDDIGWTGEIGDMVCAEGSEGPLCASCAEGYFLTDGLCKQCSGTSYLSSLTNIVVIGCIGLVVRAFIKNDGIPVPTFLVKKYDWMPERVQLPVIDALTKLDGGAVKVIYSTVQIVTSISVNLDMTFPEPFASIAGKAAFVQLDFLSIDCMKGSSYHSNVYATSAFPLVLFVVVFLSYVFSNCVAYVTGALNKTKKAQLYSFHFSAFLTITYLVLPAVASSQFKGLNCIQYANSDEAYLKADTSIDCNGPVHQEFIFRNCLMILAYQMIPVMYVVLLRSAKDRLNPPDAADEAEALRKRDEDASLQPIRFLFIDLRPSRWIHEVVDMYRRILFISVLPLMGTDPAIRAYVGCVISLGSSVYYRETMPYRVPFTNVLGTVAQYQILFGFLVALVMEGDAAKQFELTDFKIGMLLIAINMFILLAALFVGWLRHQAAVRYALKIRKKAVKIEWAVETADGVFQEQLDAVVDARVTKSHVMCYHYTSMAGATTMAKYGIPCFRQVLGADAAAVPGADKDARGIVFSLKGPHELKLGDPALERMSPQSACREAVFAVSLPRAMLEPLPVDPNAADTGGDVHEDGGLLVYLPLVTMAALAREPTREELEFAANGWGMHIPKPSKKSKMPVAATRNPECMPPLVLPPKNVLSAFQLVADEKLSGAAPKISELERLELETTPTSAFDSGKLDKNGARKKGAYIAEPLEVDSCEELLGRMAEIRDECGRRGLVPVYHFTQPVVAPFINTSGLRMSVRGHGGVSFTTRGPFSFGVGSKIYETNVITDCFGESRLKELKKSGKIDVCFVYGSEPRVMKNALGGTEHTKIVPKSFFETLSEAIRPHNDYYLRPDRIMGCFLIDPLKPPGGAKSVAAAINKESTKDADGGLHLCDAVEKAEKHVTEIHHHAVSRHSARAGQMAAFGGTRLEKRRASALAGFGAIKATLQDKNTSGELKSDDGGVNDEGKQAEGGAFIAPSAAVVSGLRETAEVASQKKKVKPTIKEVPSQKVVLLEEPPEAPPETDAGQAAGLTQESSAGSHGGHPPSRRGFRSPPRRPGLDEDHSALARPQSRWGARSPPRRPGLDEEPSALAPVLVGTSRVLPSAPTRSHRGHSGNKSSVATGKPAASAATSTKSVEKVPNKAQPTKGVARASSSGASMEALASDGAAKTTPPPVRQSRGPDLDVDSAKAIRHETKAGKEADLAGVEIEAVDKVDDEKAEDALGKPFPAGPKLSNKEKKELAQADRRSALQAFKEAKMKRDSDKTGKFASVAEHSAKKDESHEQPRETSKAEEVPGGGLPAAKDAEASAGQVEPGTVSTGLSEGHVQYSAGDGAKNFAAAEKAKKLASFKAKMLKDNQMELAKQKADEKAAFAEAKMQQFIKRRGSVGAASDAFDEGAVLAMQQNALEEDMQLTSFDDSGSVQASMYNDTFAPPVTSFDIEGLGAATEDEQGAWRSMSRASSGASSRVTSRSTSRSWSANRAPASSKGTKRGNKATIKN